MAYPPERTDTKVNIAKHLYRQGYGAPFIADKLRVSPTTIYNWFKEDGFKIESGRTDIRLLNRNQKIRRMRIQGDKLEYIAEVFKLTKQSISLICRS